MRVRFTVANRTVNRTRNTIVKSGKFMDVQDDCSFRVITAQAYAASPLDWKLWREPTLVTGAAEAGRRWRAPFDHLDALRSGRFDATLVAAGASAGAGVFDGAGSTRQTLGHFRAHMTAHDAVFDSQNSGAGRHVALSIPGAAASESGWYNVLSVGSYHAGLPLHVHGTAWLALAGGAVANRTATARDGSCRKEWVAYAPGTHGALDALRATTARPALEASAESWWSAVPHGGRRCVQPPGSVVLLPEGWTHATRNLGGACWAVGRQRPRRFREQMAHAKPAVDQNDPPSSPPSALLEWGLALRAMSLAARDEGRIDAAEQFAQPAVGMLLTAAGGLKLLTRTTSSAVKRDRAAQPRSKDDASGSTRRSQSRVLHPQRPIRLRALFAILGGNVNSCHPGSLKSRSGDGQAGSGLWFGRKGLPVAMIAAEAARRDLEAELEWGAPPAAVADGLDRLASWWACSVPVHVEVEEREAARVKVRELYVAAWEVVRDARGAAVPLAALHAGVALARVNQCTRAREALAEMEAGVAAGRWVLSKAERDDVNSASVQCSEEVLQHGQEEREL